MSNYQATIVKIKSIRKHPNADKLNLVTIFGNQVIIGKNVNEGDEGIFFEVGTQLSEDFCKNNNLFSEPSLNKDTTKKGYFSKNRRIRAQSFRGEKSEGFWVPITYLGYIGNLVNIPKEGNTFTKIDNQLICQKYINPETFRNKNTKNTGGIKNQDIPLFQEHFDTQQWGREGINKVKKGDTVIITEKLHGTSCRCSNTPVKTKLSLWHRICNFLAEGNWKTKFINVYKFVVGSRRVIKSIDLKSQNGKSFYNSDIWIEASLPFSNNLREGETVYFEIVGYEPNGRPIMPVLQNKKLEKFLSKADYKSFIGKYGEKTEFSYKCSPSGEDSTALNKYFEIYIYRITIDNGFGIKIDLTWDQVKQRCRELGVKHVPELYKTTIDVDDWGRSDVVAKIAEQPSSIFTQHVKEGVCVRIENGNLCPIILKHKSFIFKVLEGIIDENNTNIEQIES